MQTTVPIARGNFKHQGDWITAICTATNHIVTASRDKTLCVWDIKESDHEHYLRPRSILTGHNHIVQDLVLSSDGQYAISASWDKTLRLWDLNKKRSMTTFSGHKADVLSVSISKGNRQIISAGRDKTIKLWNIHGECKYTTPEQTEWITCAKFGMADDNSPIVSGGYDRLVHVWDRTTFTQKYALTGHTGYINTIAISPDSTLVASGGHDHVVNVWDIASGTYLYSLNAGNVVNSIVFSPNRFWIAVATDSALKIFCLHKRQCIADLKLQPADSDVEAAPADVDEGKKAPKIPKCLSTAFSVDGSNLFAGYSDSHIRVWNIPAATATSAN